MTTCLDGVVVRDFNYRSWLLVANKSGDVLTVVELMTGYMLELTQQDFLFLRNVLPVCFISEKSGLFLQITFNQNMVHIEVVSVVTYTYKLNRTHTGISF